MTTAQRALARHALGLPNENMRSYRNRYVASEGSSGMRAWIELVANGLAIEVVYKFFSLTKAGAQLALEPGETLDLEDFPE